MTDVSTTFVEVAREADLAERGALCVRVGGVEIGLFQTPEGILAIENACPHAGVPLHEGDVEGCVVTCLAHGFQYDLRTGYAADGADGFPIPRFAVTLRDGALCIEADRDDDGTLWPRPLPRVAPPG